VALEAELPRPGDFKRTFIGEKPVVVVRDEEGSINVVENVAPTGRAVLQKHLGTFPSSCAIPQWTYD